MHRNCCQARLVSLALMLCGCPPAPRGQDASAGGEGGGGAAVHYSAVQSGIFDRRCVTDCHEATDPGEGLTLTRDRSFGALVYQRSRQSPLRYRVLPGDQAASYLVNKIDGVSDYVGDRMPKGAPRLPQTEIDQVRTWVTRGAPND